MYKISVPIMNSNVKRGGRERVLQELRRFDAERVFLALDRYEYDPEKRKAVMKELADNCRFFKEQGFEVGAWVWAFWIKESNPYTKMRGIGGKESREFICPTDEAFLDFAADYMKELAACGVDLIQFDDDLRFGFFGHGYGCLCDGHIKAINRLTGESSTGEDLAKQLLTGGRNKYRDAWLKINGDALREFAKRARAAVDEVNLAIRMGACTCMTSWDLDGTDPDELARLLAGTTQPFYRLIGAPYWAVRLSNGNDLQDVVELERMESAWRKDQQIEIYAEGDAYPRPRSHCPANFLEGFDTAIRASGCTEGILKYGIDYISNADYETGYAALHDRNRALYRKIDAFFSGKVSYGVRVYESMKKIADAVCPTKVNKEMDLQDLFFSRAARTLAHNTIPTVYEGQGCCGICFDENARALPLEALDHGMILDIAAAEILTERGVDLGLLEIGEATIGEEEHFLHDGNHIAALGAIVYDLSLKEGAEILSEISSPLGTLPFSWRYTNEKGQRFLVLNINTRNKKDQLRKETLLRHYARSRQYADLIPWLSGKRLPAYCYGHPRLYIQTKKNEGALAIGLWNFFADPALEPVIELGEPYQTARFLNCKGTLKGDQILLEDIPPYGFCAIEVCK